MRGQIEVQTRREGFIERLHGGVEPGEIRLGCRHNLERPIQQVRVEALGSVDLAVAAEAEDVTVLDLPEVVFGLGVGETEENTLVGWTIDVRHAKRIAVDLDLPSEFSRL